MKKMCSNPLVLVRWHFTYIWVDLCDEVKNIINRENVEYRFSFLPSYFFTYFTIWRSNILSVLEIGQVIVYHLVTRYIFFLSLFSWVTTSHDSEIFVFQFSFNLIYYLQIELRTDNVNKNILANEPLQFVVKNFIEMQKSRYFCWFMFGRKRW